MSANSKDAIRESYVLIIKLLERTRQGKIEWTNRVLFLGVERGAPRPETSHSYYAELGNNLIATVWEDERSLGFSLVDSQAGPHEPYVVVPPPAPLKQEVLSILLDKEEAGMGKLTDESIVFEDLTALLELIKRTPIQSDARIEQAKKIEQARNYLDKLDELAS